jgi:rhodanese-related sulfurtransferase
VKFVIDNWYLLLTVLVTGGLLLVPLVRKTAQGGAIDAAEAVRLINREKASLIDIGTSIEFSAGHPAGAKSVPFDGLATSNDLPKNKALPVVVVSRNTARATKAVGILQKAGYEKARALAGGFNAWRDAQLPVEKSA